MSTCSVCGKTVEAGLHALRLECKCWVHTKCLDIKNPDFETCIKCKGGIIPLIEPSAYNGNDYIQNPIVPSKIQTLLKTEPFCWFTERKPLEWIVNDREYGLHRLIASGVTIDHFLNNGYDWDQLHRFPEMQKRRNLALMALGCNAEHLRDYPGCPDVDGKALMEYFGFHFPEDGGPARVAGGKNLLRWNVDDLHKFRFTMQDLLNAGMRWVEQYADLEIKDEDEPRLGVTDEQFGRLAVQASAPALPTTTSAPVQPQKIITPAPVIIVVDPMIVRRRRPHGLKKK